MYLRVLRYNHYFCFIHDTICRFSVALNANLHGRPSLHNPNNVNIELFFMAWNRKLWGDLVISGLIVLVLCIVLLEEVLGWFPQKPIGGIVTLIVVGVLGYVYFSKPLCIT